MKFSERFYRNTLLLSAFATVLVSGKIVHDILSIDPHDLAHAPDLNADFRSFFLTVGATFLSTWAYTTAREEK